MNDQLAPPARPAVLTWHTIYCGLMALLYLLTTALGIVLVVFAEEIAEHDSQAIPIEMIVIGGGLAGLSVLLMAAFAAAPFLPRQPWVWIFHLVLICLGMTSACCLPATVPLLIFWIKAETKSWFGRT